MWRRRRPPLERPDDDLRQGVIDPIGRVSIQHCCWSRARRLQHPIEELVEAGPLDHPNGPELAAIGQIDVDAERCGHLEVCRRHGDEPGPHRTGRGGPNLRCFAVGVEPSGAHRLAVEECGGVTEWGQEGDAPLGCLAFRHVGKGVISDLDEQPARVEADQLGAHLASPQNLRLHSCRPDRIHQLIDAGDHLVLHHRDGHLSPPDLNRCVGRHDATAVVPYRRPCPTGTLVACSRGRITPAA